MPTPKPHFPVVNIRRNEQGLLVPFPLTETHTVVDGFIRLHEVPFYDMDASQSSIHVAGFKLMPEHTAPLVGGVCVPNHVTGRLYFHVTDEGAVVTVSYMGIGGTISADEINYLFQNMGGGGGGSLPPGGNTDTVLAKTSNTDGMVAWKTVYSLAYPSGMAPDGSVLIKDLASPKGVKWGTLNSLPTGGLAQQALVKVSGVDYDVKWDTVSSLPTGGSTDQVLTKVDGTNFNATWKTPANPLPIGGVTRQALVKVDGTDRKVTWATVREVPVGGTADQVLAKIDAADGNSKWVTPVNPVPQGGALGQALVKKSATNFDTEWKTVTDSMPNGGTAKQVLAKKSAADKDTDWISIIEVPTGGSSDQVLAKSSNADGALKWSNVVNPVPTGGSLGQVLTKKSATNFDSQWETPSHPVPNGGTARQALVKIDSNDLKTKWETLGELPIGGTASQALVKKSATDYDAEWKTVVDPVPNGGAKGQVLAKKDSTDKNTEWVNQPRQSILTFDYPTSAEGTILNIDVSRLATSTFTVLASEVIVTNESGTTLLTFEVFTINGNTLHTVEIPIVSIQQYELGMGDKYTIRLSGKHSCRINLKVEAI